jgi:hypothetical protein
VRRFQGFACVDWSGAKGERLAGIALARCEAGSAAPRLIRPEDGGRWSRAGILAWLEARIAKEADLFVGIDVSAAFPFADRGAYFPGHPGSPPDARALWHDVDRACADEPHLGARLYAEQRADHFRIGTATGAVFATGGANGRLRVVERHAASGRPISSFNLVGPAQVGLSSLTGMRMLARLDGRLAIWPFDAVPATGPLLAEVYTSIAARAALPGRRGTKLRTFAELNTALGAPAIASAPVAGDGPIDDHASDALLTAAWLRRAAADPALWAPQGLEPVRHTEGWTFGVP